MIETRVRIARVKRQSIRIRFEGFFPALASLLRRIGLGFLSYPVKGVAQIVIGPALQGKIGSLQGIAQSLSAGFKIARSILGGPLIIKNPGVRGLG